MRKIINKSNRKLVFPKFDLALEPEEIKEISDEDFKELIGNYAIKEVLPESLKSIDEKKTKKNKSRKK